MTRNSIDKEQLMKMPKRATLIKVACLEEVFEAEMLEVLCARTDFCHLSDVPARDNTDLKTCREQSVVIMNTLGQNVNAVAELDLDMMLHSEFEVAGRRCAFHTIPS